MAISSSVEGIALFNDALNTFYLRLYSSVKEVWRRIFLFLLVYFYVKSYKKLIKRLLLI